VSAKRKRSVSAVLHGDFNLSIQYRSTCLLTDHFIKTGIPRGDSSLSTCPILLLRTEYNGTEGPSASRDLELEEIFLRNEEINDYLYSVPIELIALRNTKHSILDSGYLICVVSMQKTPLKWNSRANCGCSAIASNSR
jgi:hypothetical protein